MRRGSGQLDCPSAQPGMSGARAFGVVLGTVDQPQVAYLQHEAVIDISRLEAPKGVQLTEAFRIAATCEESRCTHFNGRRCTLGQRVVERLPTVVDALPPCTIRSTCRWYAEQAAEACLRCPQVVTLTAQEG
jgi:hypothetical protein